MSDRRRPLKRLGTCLLTSCLAIGLFGSPATASEVRQFDIGATDLASALRAYGAQSGQQILFPQELVGRLRSNAVRGSLSPEAALQILLRNTGLRAVVSATGVVTLQPAPRPVLIRAAYSEAPDPAPPASTVPVEAETVLEQQAEIVVTARRRAEDVSKVPLAVSVFSGQQLELRNVASVADLTKITPGLNISGGGTKVSPFITIRGQSRGVTGIAAPGVLTYFNDVPLATAGSLISTFDMDNVQVLKGPQGTLFGRNSLGGSILTYSKAPTQKFEGYAELKMGSNDFRQIEGALNVPVVEDVLAVRLAAQIYHDGGYTKTFRYSPHTITSGGTFVPGVLMPGGRNLDEYDGRLFRGSILFSPASWIKNITVVDYSHIRGSNNVVLDKFLSDPAGTTTPIGFFARSTIYSSTAPNIVNLFRCGTSFVCDYRLFEQLQATSGDNVGYTNSDSDDGLTRLFGITNTTTINLGSETTLKNIFSYRTTSANHVGDVDGTPFVLSGSANQTRLKVFSEELQLAGSMLKDDLKYTIGGFYYQLSPNGLGGFSASDLFTTFGNNANSTTIYLTDTSKAVYGQADYSLDVLVPGLTATAGYRHTWDEVRACIAFVPYSATSITAGLVPGAQGPIPSEAQCNSRNIPASQFPGSTASGITAQNFGSKFQKGTYTFGLNWQINSDAMIYVAKRRGYRAGGFNSSIYDPFLASVQNYKPEVLDDVEVGAKVRWRGGLPGRIELALYRGKDQGLQFPESTAGLANIATVAFVPEAGKAVAILAPTTVVNKGDLIIKGFELSATISPFPGLTLGGGVSYTDIETSSLSLDPNLAAVLRANGRVPATAIFVAQQPEWMVNANITYEYPGVVLGGQLIANADFKYSDRYLQGSTFIPAYRTVDARIVLKNIGGTGLDGAIFANNLLNEKYFYGSGNLAASVGFFSYIRAAPRTVGMSLRYNFGG